MPAYTKPRLDPGEVCTVPPDIQKRLAKEGKRGSFQHQNPTLRRHGTAGTNIRPETLTKEEQEAHKEFVEEGRFTQAEMVLCTEKNEAFDQREEFNKFRGSGHLTEEEYRQKQLEIADKANSKIGREVVHAMTDKQVDEARSTPGATSESLEDLERARNAD